MVSDQWQALQRLYEASNLLSEPFGAATAHTQAACDEAAARLISNHENVLKDVCNPSPSFNIIGVPLTQLHLQRVHAGLKVYADQALRETVRRLLGGRSGAGELEERVDIWNQGQVKAWAGTAAYLNGRIQGHPEEKPGRQPDLSPPAAAAMRAVLVEVGRRF